MAGGGICFFAIAVILVASSVIPEQVVPYARRAVLRIKEAGIVHSQHQPQSLRVSSQSVSAKTWPGVVMESIASSVSAHARHGLAS